MDSVFNRNDFRPLDIGSLVVYLVGTALTIGLVYYGLRTLKLFRRNVAGRAWTYISISSVFFGVGVVMFLIDALAPMGLVAAGGVMQTVGAFLLLLGLRKNYLFWASKDHFS
jgi:peptidoglycan biosynthesis protein MviN/MurJ (putative lipid II flippase)